MLQLRWDTYVIDVVHKDIMRLYEALQAFHLQQLIGNTELHMGQAVFTAKLIIWCDNIQTLIKITVLIHVTIQNARRNFSRCIVHCVKREKIKWITVYYY